MHELRRDPILGRWVIIASERGRRLTLSSASREPLREEKCSFCAGNENQTPPEIMAYRNQGTPANSPGWWLRVVPNKFPALKVEGELDKAGEGIYDYMEGIGAHEVIVETPDHSMDMQYAGPEHVAEVLWAYRQRMQDLKGDKRLEYILVFKNSGRAAGATIEHPHSQLIAMPIVPKRVQEELAGCEQHYERKGRCIFCDIIREEIAAGERLVFENDDYVCITPYASRFAFETWILPHRHTSTFEDTEREGMEGLARAVCEALKRIRQALNDPPYNFVLHTTPCDSGELPYYHWHIEIVPRITTIAGFEWGTGFYINPTAPEDAARYLREIEVSAT